jgi:hypothetical protein
MILYDILTHFSNVAVCNSTLNKNDPRQHREIIFLCMYLCRYAVWLFINRIVKNRSQNFVFEMMSVQASNIGFQFEIIITRQVHLSKFTQAQFYDQFGPRDTLSRWGKENQGTISLGQVMSCQFVPELFTSVSDWVANVRATLFIQIRLIVTYWLIFVFLWNFFAVLGIP